MIDKAIEATQIKAAAKAIHALDVDWFGAFAWHVLDPQERAAYRDMAAAARRALLAQGGDSVAAGAAPLTTAAEAIERRAYLEDASVIQMAAGIEVEAKRVRIGDPDGPASARADMLAYYRRLARAAFKVIPNFALNLSGPLETVSNENKAGLTQAARSDAIRDELVAALEAADEYFEAHGRRMRIVTDALALAKGEKT